MKKHWKEQFKESSRDYAMQPIVHNWPKDIDAMVEALLDFGCRGAVLNCPFENGFTSNPDNLKRLDQVMSAMDKAGLKYWLYDEQGYPSGMAGEQTLDGHPEFEAKGFYMRRIMAYEEERSVHFRLDDQSEKIVWAGKYDFETPGKHETVIHYDSMVAVPIEGDSITVELKPWQALFVFCVKRAYEGSHCTHNVSSFRHYINIMDKRAVRRFLDVAYEPIARAIPDAFKRVEAVFTDEPSLQTAYARPYEMWPYALAPWVDGLFEAYEAEYGKSLLPKLPLIFDGGADAYGVRMEFQRLVGKLIAEAWSGQIQRWCAEHDCVFSGHYLAEESFEAHVRQYGNYVQVLGAAGYPGLDALSCLPERFNYNTVKHPQIAARKKGTNGLMVEICPFAFKEEFLKAPLDNMTAVMGMLYLGGARVINSYFRPDFSQWQNGRLGNMTGYVNQDETRWFNQYIGRIGGMLDGLDNRCGTFIYYGLEELQALVQPEYTATSARGTSLAGDTVWVMRTIYEAGHDFYYADAEDLVNAAKCEGAAAISGHPVKTVIVPAPNIMDGAAFKALETLKAQGVKVLFMNRLPNILVGGGTAEGFETYRVDEILAYLNEPRDGFTFSGDGIVLHGEYEMKGGQELHYLVNKERRDVTVTWKGASGKSQALLCTPADGNIVSVQASDPLTIPAFRSVFLVFE